MHPETHPDTHPETPAPSTGLLRNGNPRGNPNLAPRCGAKARTTGCPCQAPAMKNGRCRLHGGLATGPRTPEGRARVRAAVTKHGFYTADTQAELRRTDAFIAETRALLAALRQDEAAATPPRPRRSKTPAPSPQTTDGAVILRIASTAEP